MLNRIILIIVMGLGFLSGFNPQKSPSQMLPADSHIQSAASEFFNVTFFPVAPYYVGDILSIQVNYTGPDDFGGKQILLSTPHDPDRILGTETFRSSSQEAIFYWIVDTTGFEPGFVPFYFQIPSDELSWTAGVNLLPGKSAEQPEWQSASIDCCLVNYLSGTQAEQDLQEILQILESEADAALSQFIQSGITEDDPFEEPLKIALIPSVVGHGGFATDTAVMTYTHRNWTGIEFDILAHHEIVHVIDRHLNPGSRPKLFSEGLAVYLSGGHYHKGDALARGAALLETGLYLPLAELTEQFYDAQHEIAYMQAGALMAYLVETWGWEQLIDFYFSLPEGRTDTEIISTALEERFKMDFESFEADFITYLESIHPDQSVISDVLLTISAYDTVRRYQSIVIPSAHFQTAWWPSITEMIEAGIVGDYASREKSPFNIVIESLLIDVHTNLVKKDFDSVENALENINQILSEIETQGTQQSHYSLGLPLPILRPITAPSIKILP